MDRPDISDTKQIIGFLRRFPIPLLKIYPASFTVFGGLTYGLIRIAEGKRLTVIGENPSLAKDAFRGEVFSGTPGLKLCDLSPENTQCLMSLFPHTRPTPVLKYPRTLGTGDRLGVATPGHIRSVRKFDLRPVFAQQSVRENTQTGRDYGAVIRDAAWAVFQENYRKGYGADGDHLKSLKEIQTALDTGVTMVTLDLSEKLDPKGLQMPAEEVERTYGEVIDEEESKVLFHLYLGKEFCLKSPQGECRIQYREEDVKRNALLFHKAVNFTEEVYAFIRSRKTSSIDFEVSIDETPFPTSPENHLFFVIQLNQRGVRIDSLAPRFPGEFQKGIDYVGDLTDFRQEFSRHVVIARHYGYKISIHSGSDKFSVFPDIGRLAKDGLHVKTAGTSWLEAMRLVALRNPALFRQMHRFALGSFKEASALYHVTTDLGRIPDPDTVQDDELAALLDRADPRQLLHITYGFLLNAEDHQGKSLFRDRLYALLAESEEDYWSLLEGHIDRHVTTLGVKKEMDDGRPIAADH